MSQEVRPDFLNLQIWARRLEAMLAGTPHELVDSFGNKISSLSPELCGASQMQISLRGKVVANLRAPDSQGSLLKPIIEGTLESEFQALLATDTLDASQLVSHDIDSLLELSESESVPLEEQLSQILRLLRAHVWAERSSIFGMMDGFTLEGLVALGWANDDWKSLYSTAAGLAASTRMPYVSEEPAKDKHLQGRPGIDSLRNLLCVPLLHGKTVLGVLNVSNCVAGNTFSQRDLEHVKRFASVASHLLQKFVFKTKMQEFEQDKIKLGKYLSQNIVKNVEDTGEITLGGREKKVICLFSDIRGYTSITEGISPETLVRLLNFHFECMHVIIEEKHGGTIDKIVGDLVMAVWNFPHDQPEPELLAMKAALEMQKEMIRTVIPEWQRHGVEKVGMGVGVNSGTAIAGNLGSSRFMNYTVIGDAVNTAQRLESKARAGEIWMNENMYPMVHGKLEKPVRRELEIRLKGKEQTINALVYKPLHY